MGKTEWARAEKRSAYVVGQWSVNPPYRHDPSQPYGVIVAEVAQFKGNFVVYSDHVGHVITGDYEDIAFDDEHSALRRCIELNRQTARRLDNAADIQERRLDEIVSTDGVYPAVNIGHRVMVLGSVRGCPITIFHAPDAVQERRGVPGIIGTVIEVDEYGSHDHNYLVEHDSGQPPQLFEHRVREWCTRLEITHAAPGEKSPSEILTKVDDKGG